jgi:SAM-dependent methyltransferase
VIETATTCVACGSDRLARYSAVIAPFILARIPSLAGRRASLVWCRACDFAFFDPRLGSDELAALYRGYRGPDYQRERQAHEPAYTPELNDRIGGAQEIAVRRSNMRAVLGRHVALGAVRSVLDYGGDRGQFILDELSAARRIVYEVSGVRPLDGVVAASRWEDVCTEKYDLVLCNHVLEHVSDPGEIVRKVREVAHERSWLYFEVPAESPFTFDRLSAPKAILKRALLRFPRVADAVLGPFGRPTMHEHVNAFSTASLAALLERCGLRVAEATELELDVGWKRPRVISALASLR